MKKVLLIVLLSVSTIQVFSEELFETPPSWFALSPLILDGLDKNAAQISLEARNFSDEQLFMLYQLHKKSPWEAFALNLTLGFGLGSLYQRDLLGVGIGYIGDVAGICMTLIGAEMLYRNPWTDQKRIGNGVMITGIVLLSTTRFVEILLPFIHEDNYNRRLLEILTGHLRLP
jgi:hypothetical protein